MSLHPLDGLRHLEERLRKSFERRRKAAERCSPAPRFAQGDVFRLPEGLFAGLELIVAEPNEGMKVRLENPQWNFSVEISAWSLRDIQLVQA